jgi:hypothetical protein
LNPSADFCVAWNSSSEARAAYIAYAAWSNRYCSADKLPQINHEGAVSCVCPFGRTCAATAHDRSDLAVVIFIVSVLAFIAVLWVKL